MASGIEVAGIALAVFPIVVQSFGSYAQGIETIKKLRRQRRELESYVRVLKTQRVYYLDTIEELLDGIVELDALNEMLQDFDSISWQASEYEQRLQDRLGRSYNSFLESCSELRDSLKSIERKLQASHDTSSSSNTMEDRFRRLKVVLSRTIYDEHVESIRRANTEIRDIVHQNLRLEDPRRRRKLPKAVIHHYSRARRHARSLHKVLMGSGCWQCNAQCRHVANIRLECKDSTLSSGTQSSEATRINVLLALSTKCAPPEASDAFQWKELAIEPVQEVTSTQRLNSAATSITSLSTKVNESTSKAGDPFQLFGKVSREKGKKSVSFALSATGTSTAIGAALGSFNDKEPSPISKPPSMIHDLCSMLREISTCPRAHECIGILTDGIQQSMQHQLFLLNSDRKVTETCSLESLLRTKQIKLSRGDRLRIASRLASSILQFEGSWFKDTWRSYDILFMKDEVETRDSLINRTPYSYLSWSVSKGDPTNLPNIDSHLGVDNSDEHLIRSKPLLYLGIALIELAFGNTLEELCIERNISFSSQPPAKTDAMTVLSIATKLLNDVSGESGPRYGDVVRRCLQCPYDIRDTSLDNDEFQQAILETVVTPLVDDLKVFEGASRIR